MNAPVPELAAACKSRLFPAGVFGGAIQYDNTILDMSQVELALIEKCLRHVEQRDNLLVINPFSTKLTPAFLILSYMASADPRRPSDLQTTDRAPALLFPSNTGYLGELDNFNYRDEINASGIYDRDPIRSMGEYSTAGNYQLYSATGDIVIPDQSEDRIGLLFVDLRNDSWQQNFHHIERLLDTYKVDSALFYSDTDNAGTDTAQQIVAETLTVSRGTFSETDTATPGENPTPARIQESILSNPIKLSFPVDHSEKIDAGLRQLYALRCNLTESFDNNVYVELLNGLLLDLPVSPSRYDEMANQNAFYQSTYDLLDNIEDRIIATPGDESQMFEKFVAQAREVRRVLERSHPKQAVLDEIIQDTQESETPLRLVARNLMFEQALEQYLYTEYGSIPEYVELYRTGELTPNHEAKTVFTSAPDSGDQNYAFPPSNQITVLTYPFFVDTVIDRFDGTEFEGESPPLEVEERPSAEPPSPDDDQSATEMDSGVVNLSNIEIDISPSLTDSSGGSSYTDSSPDDGPIVELEFADSTTRQLSVSRRVTVYDREHDDIERKPAGQVSSNDQLVITEEAASDLYHEVIEIKHSQKDVKEHEQYVDRWRELLNNILDRDGMTHEKLLSKLKQEGSNLSTTAPIERWATGEALGPQSIDDVRNILRIADPRFEDQYQRVYEAMKYIRTLHRQTGRRVKQVIIAELDPERSANIDSDLVTHLEEMIDQAEIKRVVNVNRG